MFELQQNSENQGFCDVQELERFVEHQHAGLLPWFCGSEK
jgi:hypothetical protein